MRIFDKLARGLRATRTTMRASGPPTLDAGYVERLAAHLGRETVLELLADGLIELTDRLAELARLARAGDRAGVVRLAHDITGVAGHLGLSALSAEAARLHRDLRGAQGPATEDCAGRLSATGEAAIAALGAALREGGWLAGPGA